ncbi:hypothetical protein [Ciceribacter thiooxidans]|nr:hypothetical protein [Ciceribacter thiooxidans]
MLPLVSSGIAALKLWRGKAWRLPRPLSDSATRALRAINLRFAGNETDGKGEVR